jgi:hypothetical protein
MGLPERLEAARLVVKYRAILRKEIPASEVRLKKWDNLITEAAGKKLVPAANQARDALRAADRYDVQINKIAGLIKRVSLLDDNSQKINAFIANMKKHGMLANKAYKDYVFEKDLFWTTFDPGSWDDRLLRWLRDDQPSWEAAFRVFKEFTRLSVNVSIA